MLLLITTLISCTTGTPTSKDNKSNSGAASISINLLSPFQTTKNSQSTTTDIFTNRPTEITKIELFVLSDRGAILNQKEVLSSGGDLNLQVDTDTALQLIGEIWAGTELLYSGFESIAALSAGDQRSINLNFDAKVSLKLQEPAETSNGTKQFTVLINGLSNLQIRWFVDGIEGGNNEVGTIDNFGNYTEPQNIIKNEVTIKAVPIAAPSFAQEFINRFSIAPSEAPVLTGVSGNASAILRWNAINTASDYTIFRSDELDTTPQIVATTIDTDFEDIGLINGTAYTYFITANNPNNVEQKSNSIIVTPKLPDPPTIPTAFIATIGNEAIILQWNSIVDAESYVIYRAQSEAELAQATPWVTTSFSSYQDKSVVEGVQYFYTVIAQNSFGESARSEIASATYVFTPPLNNFLDNIEDVSLKTCIEKYNIFTPSELTILICNDKGVVSLKGLEQFTELVEIELWGNSIVDISPIGTLTKLQSVTFGTYLDDRGYVGNSIVDISPVANLTSLTKLFLGGNEIVDITPISNLTSLTDLSFRFNNIVDISPVSNLQLLTYLSLGSNHISDISPVSNLLSLNNLYLSSNDISDISPITNLVSLKELYLGSNHVTDISAISNLVEMTELRLRFNQISDINPVKNLTSLTFLGLGSNNISDISAVSNLRSLNYLGLFFNNISDISVVSNLTSLKRLYLGNNQISDITSLANLVSVENLYIGANQIVNIKPIENLTSITKLDLSSNRIVDLSPISKLSSLTKLDLDSNQINNISPLASLRSLLDLHLEANQIMDITPLANLITLRDLWLSINQISDIGPISDLHSLNFLRLRRNRIVDISAVANLDSLAHLNLSSNQITDISAVRNLTSLTFLGLDSNQITDISPVSNMNSLKNLSLNSNNISDISTVSNLTSLTGLGLGVNKINEISHIANLTSLTNLTLHNNNIIDISPLANLVLLKELFLNSNQISDISPLRNLIAINRLYLNSNLIADVSALSNMNKLSNLRLDSNPNLLCSSVKGLDSQFDINDGNGSGVIKWDNCAL